MYFSFNTKGIISEIIENLQTHMYALIFPRFKKKKSFKNFKKRKRKIK